MVKQPMMVNGVTRWRTSGVANEGTAQNRKPVVLRQEIGDVLRDIRQRQGRTLREVSHNAHVSLGYLSEVERGQKEASSDLLASICSALDVPLSTMLREASDRVALAEGIIPDTARMTHIPDTVPHELDQEYALTVTDGIGKSLKNEYITAA